MITKPSKVRESRAEYFRKRRHLENMSNELGIPIEQVDEEIACGMYDNRKKIYVFSHRYKQAKAVFDKHNVNLAQVDDLLSTFRKHDLGLKDLGNMAILKKHLAERGIDFDEYFLELLANTGWDD